MTSFTRTWNSAYEGIPDNSEDARKGASRIRELKQDIRERFGVDHSVVGDDKDGAHLRISLYPQATDPVTIPGGTLYIKASGSNNELFYKNNNGVVIQLTFATSPLSNVVATGTILAFGNLTAVPVGYLACNGVLVSRTTYSTLFGIIGTVWGVGDGVTTFGVPDLRGRAPIGQGQGGYSGASLRTSGQLMGEEVHTLLITELAQHSHLVAGHSGALTPGGVGYQASDSSDFIGNTGDIFSGAAVAQPHNNMQPSAVVNYVIKY